MSNGHEVASSPITAQLFGNANIAPKDHRHSVRNANGQFQNDCTPKQIQQSQRIHDLLTKHQCKPTSDSSAACVLASEAFVRMHRLEAQAVEMLHSIGVGEPASVGLYRHGFSDENAMKVNLTAATNDVSETGSGFQVTPYLAVLERAIQDDKDNLMEKVRGVYGLKVTNGPDGKTGYWVINAKTGRGKVTYNGTEKPDVTFIVNDADVVELVSGELPPQRAFFMGRIRIQGDMGFAMKLMNLQRATEGKIDELRSKL